MREYLLDIVITAAATLATFVLLFFFAGCKTCTPVVQTEYRDSIVTRLQIDSVRVLEKDSVFIKERGDTIKIERWRTMWRERVVQSVDTIYKDRVQERTIKVRERSGYDKFVSWAFWIIVVIVLLWVAWKLVKKYYLKK